VKVASVLALLVASLALVATGCGGDDEAAADPTAEWAEGFCAAITTWTDDITEATDELRSLSSLSRDSFEQAANDIRTATSEFGDELRALGSPETESGEEARQAIDDFATTLDEDSADIESAIQEASGITDIPGAVQDITASLSSMNAAFSEMLSTIRTDDAQNELETAFEEADACDDIG
jgi:methyl-accepting chemotaxis protein